MNKRYRCHKLPWTISFFGLSSVALLGPLDQKYRVFSTGVWLSKRMMAIVDKTNVAICVSPQVNCLVPTLHRLLLMIRRSGLQPCSVAGVEMWVLPTSQAEPRCEHSHFSSSLTFLQSSTVIPDFLIYAFLPKPRGSQFQNSHWHLRLFTTSSVPYFCSWPCSHSPAVCHRWKDRVRRWVFICPNYIEVDTMGEQIFSSLKEGGWLKLTRMSLWGKECRIFLTEITYGNE